ncbi:MAG: dolichyl-diphosphooligosaccharide--protein glycosyltransferase subunit STT3, partial [Methanobacterium sp.]|nr:dolichyl-diphosphooligosaccharide--protein glycosyltransferase subunit STT3 [Euryarchaeota archaeon]MBV1729880.1 dolichyl-diphosphooligosaccharide--protein glycosyltransferase subunit STT3 [Methanobacterium sp.]
MLEKNYLIKILIVITIFLIGFSIRLDSTNLNSISPEEQGYYRDEYNNPYMYEIDSYYHYRLAYNYIKTGSMGDTIINGQEWDLKSYYPPGRVV